MDSWPQPASTDCQQCDRATLVVPEESRPQLQLTPLSPINPQHPERQEVSTAFCDFTEVTGDHPCPPSGAHYICEKTEVPSDLVRARNLEVSPDPSDPSPSESNSSCLLGTLNGPGVILRILHELTHLVFITTRRGKYCFPFHFTAEETEAPS